MSRPFRLIDADWPDYDAATQPRARDARVYRARLSQTRERMQRAALDHLVVYAGREHFGTIL